MEEVDTSSVAHLTPCKPCPTIPLVVNSSHSLQSCPNVFSALPPPALDLGTLPRSAPILNPISNWESKLVVNLSPAPIDPLAFNFLKRGLNFALTPRNIPHIDFLIKIENAVRTLPLDIAEEVRQDCAVALRYAKPPKFNIPKAELLAFNNLMHNNDLIISRADKGPRHYSASPLTPFGTIDPPSHPSSPRTLNAQQLVMENLRKAAEARKILELNLLKYKMEIEASWCHLPNLEDFDRGAPNMTDTISRASTLDLELSSYKEHNGLNTEDPLTRQGVGDDPTLEEVPTTPLDELGNLQDSRETLLVGPPTRLAPLLVP
ncbi:hypothetical protein SUGI_1083720 [Cryptomeria japonica]|nr:hypothetical protein SUGI_1083720 [Cryptomeria japonica]